jgi:predicted SAM-dependent methyltransferase
MLDLLSRREVGSPLKLADLKRSQFVVGMVRALRGLIRDARVLVWIVKRKSKIAVYLNTHPVAKLQIGASNNILDGWLNTDIFLNHKQIVYLDTTARFPFDDNTFDYVMAEHMIEHIEYKAAEFMLQQCFRVLKPGGHARFSTPDLGVLLALHCAEKTEAQKRYIDWLIAHLMPDVEQCKDVFVINNAFRAWGHSFLYDQETLRHLLHTSGFREIKFYKPGDSDDPNLRNLECHGKEISDEDINQFETIVAEARKQSTASA